MEKRILCIPSAATQITLESGKVVPTGYFLSELAIPAQILRAAGFRLTYATSNGAPPSLDPLSDKPMWFGFSTEGIYFAVIVAKDSLEYQKAKEFLLSETSSAAFDRPTPLASLTEAELQDFSAVFIPGGHGPMVDLADNADMARILEHFMRRKKIIASLCHGPAAFLSLSRSAAPFAMKNIRMTCYSNIELAQENMQFLVWWSTPQWRVATRLSDAGAIVTNSVPLSSHVIVDQNVITAQGPAGAKNLGEAIVQELKKLPVTHSITPVRQERLLAEGMHA